jgi:hypothetical protein
MTGTRKVTSLLQVIALFAGNETGKVAIPFAGCSPIELAFDNLNPALIAFSSLARTLAEVAIKLRSWTVIAITIAHSPTTLFSYQVILNNSPPTNPRPLRVAGG